MKASYALPLFALLLAVAAHAETPAAIKAKGEIVFANVPNYPPFEFKDPATDKLKDVAGNLNPLLKDLRPALHDLRPTIRDLNRLYTAEPVLSRSPPAAGRGCPTGGPSAARRPRRRC